MFEKMELFAKASREGGLKSLLTYTECMLVLSCFYIIGANGNAHYNSFGTKWISSRNMNCNVLHHVTTKCPSDNEQYAIAVEIWNRQLYARCSSSRNTSDYSYLNWMPKKIRPGPASRGRSSSRCRLSIVKNLPKMRILCQGVVLNLWHQDRFL